MRKESPMVQTELVDRSPLRILEQALRGGPGPGDIAVLASPKGVGKTACLVHIATDKLLQGRQVIHVSYASRVDYIITWYEDIFAEISRRMKDAVSIHDELTKNRVIMNFKQEGMKTEQILRSLEALITCGRFAASAIIVDGYDFARGAADDLARIKEFAGRMGLQVWVSASLREADGPLYDAAGFPPVLAPYLASIDVLITLHAKGEVVELKVVKDHDAPPAGVLPLKLDPKTLLLAREE